MFTARRLESSAEQHAAWVLLHQVWMEGSALRWPENHPSGLRIELGPYGRFELRDKYDDSISWWFGVFHGGRCVGCLRVMVPCEGLLDLEHFHPLPSSLEVDRDAVVEINRFALAGNYRSSAAPFYLVQEALRFANTLRPRHIFTTAHEPEPAGLWRKLGFQASESDAFRFFGGDPVPVRLFHLDAQERESLERSLNLCDRSVA